MGLSYESSQLAHPGFFSASNGDLVGLFRRLSPTGVLRIGGNTSEFSQWERDAGEVISSDVLAEGPDTNGGGTHAFAVRPIAIRNLSEFLRATGWKLIYGLNLAGGSTSKAVEECSFVARECGDSLLAFQLGNEPEMFHHGTDPKDRWSYEEYIARWKTLANALELAVPNLPLAGPDISYKTEWVGRFADDTKGKIAFLSGHFYPEGPPSDRSATVDFLLEDRTKFESQVAAAARMAAERHVPYRMTEGNSCYNGGKKGVSDTFAGALWAADFILRAASLGCIGVNMHGGGNGLYTPIAGSVGDGFVARPEYYGLLMAAGCSGGDLVECHVAGDSAISCYAVRKSSTLHVFCFNRSPRTFYVEIEKSLAKPGSQVRVLWLAAPSIEATGQITYGGDFVSPSGGWHGHANDLQLKESSFLMPPYTAATLEFV